MTFKNTSTFFLITALIILLTSVFFLNLLGRSDNGFFKDFQQGSETTIIGKIKADTYHLSTNGYGYGKYNEESNTFSNKTSLVGLQGFVYSFIYNVIGISSFRALNLISCFLLAVVVMTLAILIKKKYDMLFSVVFFAVCLLSPWTVAMARNLYWVEFLMFLPAIFSLLIILSSSEKCLYICLFFTFLTSFAKSLCGYEFLTTILLFAVSFLVIEFFLTESKEQRMRELKKIFLFTGFFILGFLCAVLIHASLRGETVTQGITSIWQEDVLRRTLGGNVDDFAPVYAASLLASPIKVIYRYVYDFYTPIILGVDGKYFMLMSFYTFVVLIYSSVKSKKIISFQNVAFAMFGTTALSWLVLGKSHSFIHTHINYIVFYFGYVQICIYILLRFVFSSIPNIKNLVYYD